MFYFMQEKINIFVIVNHLILVAKFYNDCCKLNGVKNSNAGLKNKNVSNTQYRR